MFSETPLVLVTALSLWVTSLQVWTQDSPSPECAGVPFRAFLCIYVLFVMTAYSMHYLTAALDNFYDLFNFSLNANV